MVLQTILLHCHRSAESGLSTWTSIATILSGIAAAVGIFMSIYALNTQKRNAKELARMQLKHEALKVLRNEFNDHFFLWEKDKENAKHPLNCKRTIEIFETNYNYLFNFKATGYFQKLKDILEGTKTTAEEDLEKNFNKVKMEELKAKSLSNFEKAKECWEALLAELGKIIIELK